MQLSKKQKTFSQFFAVFLKSTSNVEHFEKNMSLIGIYIPEIIDCEIRVDLNV